MNPHPITGQPFDSPVPPGTGWPDDPADAQTPVATTAQRVRGLADAAADNGELNACISVCRACERLVQWRESVATGGRRASFADQPYWGRPGPGFGDPQARVLLVGLAPAANGTNRTGRMFTGDSSGDWLYAALHRAGYASQPDSIAAGDGMRLEGVRIVASVRCAPPQNKPTAEEKATCAPWLDRDLRLAEPTLESIMALGAIGWDATVVAARRVGWDGPVGKLKFGHGTQVSWTTPSGRSIRLLGCYHVSPHNTFTGRLTETMLDELIARL